VTGGLYVEPRTVEEAVAATADYGPDAALVAGGTDLVVLARKRRAPLPRVLVTLHRIDAMRGIDPVSFEGVAMAYGGPPPEGTLRIGAITSHAEVERHPDIVDRFTALADGSALVGSPATRHVGTIGGNLTNASPANDTGSPLLVFNASVELWSDSGVRNLALADFFTGPGRTALRPGEILSSVVIPRAPSTPAGSAYIRLDYRQAMEIAVVGAAVMVMLTDDSPKAAIEHARLALTAVAPTCIEVDGVDEMLRGRDPDDPAAWADAGRRAAEAAAPIDDVRAPAGYRAAMIPIVVRRAFDVAVRRARGERVTVPATLALAREAP
jgi:CO/xanthine dehydrogenase FAD-binding subunit